MNEIFGIKNYFFNEYTPIHGHRLRINGQSSRVAIAALGLAITLSLGLLFSGKIRNLWMRAFRGRKNIVVLNKHSTKSLKNSSKAEKVQISQEPTQLQEKQTQLKRQIVQLEDEIPLLKRQIASLKDTNLVLKDEQDQVKKIYLVLQEKQAQLKDTISVLNDKNLVLKEKHAKLKDRRNLILIRKQAHLKVESVESVVTKNQMQKIVKPDVTKEQLENFKKIFFTNSQSIHYGESYLDKHGEVLCQASLISNFLNQQGIPVVYTAQRIQAIFLQVVMKKMHETLKGDLGKNKKIMRSDLTGTVFDIKEVETHYDKPTGWDYKKGFESLVCASCNLFHQQIGESMNFFLNNGISHFKFHLGKFLRREIEKAYPKVDVQKKTEFVTKIKTIYQSYSYQLPFNALLMIILDVDDPSLYAKLTGTWGKDASDLVPSGETLKQYLISKNQQLTNFESIPQVRLLAPRANLPRMRALRLLNVQDRKIFKLAKIEIQHAVDLFCAGLKKDD